MVKFTPKYNLAQFENFNDFNIRQDRDRMIIVDNQLGFLADLIGDGIVDGLFIESPDSSNFQSSSNEYTINVTKGGAIIDKFFVSMYGDVPLVLKNNSTHYLFLQRKKDVVGGVGPFSKISEVSFIDSLPPATPINLSLVEKSFSSIKLSWDKNVEVDFDFYILERSIDNITFTEVARINENVFLDENLSQDTIYYYRIKSVDVNGNESSYSPAFMSKTNKDLREPLPPSLVDIFSLDESLQLLWEPPEFGDILGYEIFVQELGFDFQPTSTTFSFTPSSGKRKFFIPDLKNNVNYKVQLFSISINNVLSSPVEFVKKPLANDGPKEVEDVELSSFTTTLTPSGVGLKVEWIPVSGSVDL